MEELEFEWDAEKAWANARKHGVTFAEGATVFGDRLARLMAERTIHGEDRQVMVGLSALGRLLVVVFVDRGRIRIISTRRATPFERNEHEEAGR
jgi:uncharacterized DUF497 family protein